MPTKSVNSLQSMAQAPASAIKKDGWRSMMRIVRSSGALLITNHKRPEAVIVSLEQYDRLLRQAGDNNEDKALLDKLRMRFDRRLDALGKPGAADKLRRVMDAPASLRNEVRIGPGR